MFNKLYDISLPVISGCQYDVSLPLWSLPICTVWCLPIWIMSSQLRDVCLPVWCLSTCIMSTHPNFFLLYCNYVWILVTCLPICIMYACFYFVFLPVSCLVNWLMSAYLIMPTFFYLCLHTCIQSAVLYHVCLPVWRLPTSIMYAWLYYVFLSVLWLPNWMTSAYLSDAHSTCIMSGFVNLWYLATCTIWCLAIYIMFVSLYHVWL
jgi:hypothetical protein